MKESEIEKNKMNRMDLNVPHTEKKNPESH